MKRHLLSFFAVCVTVLTLIFPAQGRTGDDLGALIDVLGIERTLDIMRLEGLKYGAEVADDMLSSVDESTWRVTLERIYDTGKMKTLIEASFKNELEGVDQAPLMDFFSSDLGVKIIDHELAAREAFLDPEMEAAGLIMYEQVKEDEDPVIAQIDMLIDDSDLIELNVMGSLNSNLMFYRGLVDGGAIEMSEEEMLSDVWSQEDDIRADTENWMAAFLLAAYRQLEKAELDAYIALYQSPEGRALNRVMFVAFDQMYDEISYLLGQAVAQNMHSEEL